MVSLVPTSLPSLILHSLQCVPREWAADQHPEHPESQNRVSIFHIHQQTARWLARNRMPNSSEHLKQGPAWRALPLGQRKAETSALGLWAPTAGGRARKLSGCRRWRAGASLALRPGLCHQCFWVLALPLRPPAPPVKPTPGPSLPLLELTRRVRGPAGRDRSAVRAAGS